jgi:hypothetical protein
MHGASIFGKNFEFLEHISKYSEQKKSHTKAQRRKKDHHAKARRTQRKKRRN